MAPVYCSRVFLNRPPFAVWKKWLAVVVAFHFFAGMAMAASPALHKLVHHDADADDHDCAATLFVHGGCDLSLAPVECPAPALTDFTVAVWPEWEIPVERASGGAFFGRGPPRVS